MVTCLAFGLDAMDDETNTCFPLLPPMNRLSFPFSSQYTKACIGQEFFCVFCGGIQTGWIGRDTIFLEERIWEHLLALRGMTREDIPASISFEPPVNLEDTV